MNISFDVLQKLMCTAITIFPGLKKYMYRPVPVRVQVQKPARWEGTSWKRRTI